VNRIVRFNNAQSVKWRGFLQKGNRAVELPFDGFDGQNLSVNFPSHRDLVTDVGSYFVHRGLVDRIDPIAANEYSVSSAIDAFLRAGDIVDVIPDAAIFYTSVFGS